MKLDWPQITYLVLVFIGMLLAARDHGKPKTGTENFFTTIFASSIGWTLLYFGGFFSK